jgi:uncharacterized membrane protein
LEASSLDVGGLLNIKGTPDSAGFGLIGLVGPIKSLNLLDMGTTSGLLWMTYQRWHH